MGLLMEIHHADTKFLSFALEIVQIYLCYKSGSLQFLVYCKKLVEVCWLYSGQSTDQCNKCWVADMEKVRSAVQFRVECCSMLLRRVFSFSTSSDTSTTSHYFHIASDWCLLMESSHLCLKRGCESPLSVTHAARCPNIMFLDDVRWRIAWRRCEKWAHQYAEDKGKFLRIQRNEELKENKLNNNNRFYL